MAATVKRRWRKRRRQRTRVLEILHRQLAAALLHVVIVAGHADQFEQRRAPHLRLVVVRACRRAAPSRSTAGRSGLEPRLDTLVGRWPIPGPHRWSPAGPAIISSTALGVVVRELRWPCRGRRRRRVAQPRTIHHSSPSRLSRSTASRVFADRARARTASGGYSVK